MRLYGKKFLRNKMIERAQARQETRDAILWDVLPTQRLCRVKIQGSNQLIVARYPENWEQTPFWLKPGNAVKIVHTGGIRGHIEVIGHGQLVPTPAAGDQFPTPAAGENCVLTGCQLLEISADPRMAVLVTTGTYRIGGTVYTLGGALLGNSNMILGDGYALGEIAGLVTIDAAPAEGLARIDRIVVGTDGVIDYVKGTASSSPTAPATPSNHVSLGTVLVPSGTTAILNQHINRTWSTPEPSELLITVTDSDLAWDELSTTVRVQVRDQYGRGISGPLATNGWYIQLEIMYGNGTVHSDEEGDSESIIGAHTGVLSYYDFTYTRNQEPDDSSPTLRASCFVGNEIEAYAMIFLRDEFGEIMR